MLFTRDLRVHDHPALQAAAAADRVVAMFVFDATVLASSFAAPNRVAFLLESVTALRQSLADRGGSLVLRHGEVTAEVADVVAETGASVLHVTADVSAYARRRAASLRAAMAARGVDLQVHPGHLLVDPGQVTPVGGDHYKVFTPYWRRWREAGRRAPLPAPTRRSSPPIHAGAMPTLDELTSGPCSPDRQTGGAPAARARLDAWLDGPIAEYESARDDLANPAGTSRLSADLHFGTISVAEIADRLDLRRRGHAPFLRQLCWRDFNHQLLAAVPSLPTRDYRTRGDDWHDDPDGLQAWRAGTTGYPVVDAGMRQLRREGYLHNRARMIVASFLTKHLYIDWRRGAAHFFEWLTDGDLANNVAQWQWAAGTGNDSRPNRMYNPVVQSRRHDPTGAYLRTYVPEIAHLDDRAIHAPWETDDPQVRAAGYPAPIVAHAEARERFLFARGAVPGP